MKIRLVTAIWCTSCLIMRPRYQKLLQEHPEWEFEELDFDSDQGVISHLNLGKILPVAILEKDHKEVLRIIGEKSLNELHHLLETNL